VNEFVLCCRTCEYSEKEELAYDVIVRYAVKESEILKSMDLPLGQA